ncbi:MAG: NAD(P)/FAD-dependent oxidoreductase [Deltaproteobacteria bacterium]|nr:NAD(P)/FAD-dependent oxidoreductase [Deltaproteobacteria bacterium]
MDEVFDVVVIGGGASGLMAAGRAAECGASVLLLEKMARLGLKLGITGKGRCNLTNLGDITTFLKSYAPDGKFLRNVYGRFFNRELLAFFEERGVPLEVERGQRVFPASNRALDVVSALLKYTRQGRVTIVKEAAVEGIESEGGVIRGVRQSGQFQPARAVILATGGASYPQTGSTGDGYRLAEGLGHTVAPIHPHLVPLVIAEPWVAELQGLALKNVRATLYQGGKPDQTEFGELLFTHFGLSGPIVLTLSGRAVELLARGPVEIVLNLKPGLDERQVDLRLQREFQTHSRQMVKSILKNLLPAKLIPFFLLRAGVDGEKPAHQISAGERKQLGSNLRAWPIPIAGHRPLAEAIITAGGISLKEVDPRTLESRLVKNLFFCGEVLDIQGMTGGFNLQAAFSTGWVAGGSAAERVKT